MNRSKKFAFVSFCLLAQGVRADGIVRKYPAVVEPIIKLLMQKNINIIQMPCPELIFDSFHRQPCQKKKYDLPKNRDICNTLSSQIVEQIKLFTKNGCKVEVILGIEFSPSCAVYNLYGPYPNRVVNGSGIFIEELKKILHLEKIKIPILGVSIYSMENTINELNSILKEM